MSEEIRFFEVGPRDGLQNEESVVAPSKRIELVEKLAATGAKDVEIGSFVHPGWVPQMEGTDEIARAVGRGDETRYWALVPNMKGLERALAAGLEYVAVFMSATESHNRKNLNRSRNESLKSLEATIGRACSEGLGVRAYISTAFGCPFEGDVDFDEVLRVGESLLEMGADHISLGDTIGAGSPPAVENGCRRAVKAFGTERVALHLHDTQGLAVANALVAYRAGVRLFDGAVGGMGGCPYAPGAAGNVASEDLLNLFEKLGADTGVDIGALCRVSTWIAEDLGFSVGGRYCDYWQARQGADDE